MFGFNTRFPLVTGVVEFDGRSFSILMRFMSQSDKSSC